MSKLRRSAKLCLGLIASLLCVTVFSGCDLQKFVSQSSTSISSTVSSSESQDWHYRWLRGEPCRAPCWEGITPGVTTASEATKILNQNPLILNVTNPISYNGLGSVNWGWSKNLERSSPGWGGDALYDPVNPTQTIFAIRPSLVGFLKFNQIEAAYGNPTNVIATLTLNPEGGKYSYELWLLYLNYGFVVRTENPNSIKPEISSDTTFEVVDFFVPSLEGFKKLSEVRSRIIVNWQGIKPFEFYCKDASGDGSQDCAKYLKDDNARNH